MVNCAVSGCKSNNDKRLRRNQNPTAREKISYFRFPRETRLRQIWLRKCGRPENDSVKNPVVCAKHFLPDDFIPDLPKVFENYERKCCRLLKTDAIPSENLPPPLECSSALREIEHLPSELNREQMTMETLSSTGASIVQQEDVCTVDCGNCKDRLKISTSAQTTEEIGLKIKLSKAMDRIQLLEEKVQQLTRENEALKATLKPFEELFTPGQRRRLQNSKRVTWDIADISQAIALHASGPKAYRLLRNRNFPLPAVSTLRRWATKVDTSPGYLTCVFSLMRNANLNTLEKVCILMADEMKVQSAYEYDRKADYLYGPANYVQVIMARGLFANWKQPVFYRFDSNLSETAVNTIITKLHGIGYDVVAAVSDLGGGNRSLWKKLAVTESRPYFAHPCDASKKVYVFVDAPHLIKLLRNHFLDSGFHIDGKFLTCEPLRELLDVQSKSDLHISSRLSTLHLTVKRGERQKVKYATQLFSHTNSCALLRMGTLGIAKSHHWQEVAAFLKQVNDWFDIFNSRVPRIDSRPRMAAYGLQMVEHDRILAAINSTISAMRVGSRKSLLPFQRGIIQNINALKLLYCDVRDRYGIQYLLTSRINQDPLEMFFGVMRAKGGLYDHPTALQFRYRLRSYLLGRNEWIPSESTNVQETVEEDTPMEVAAAIFDAEANDSARENSDVDALTSTLLRGLAQIEDPPEDSLNEVADLEYDALEYLAGYILHRFARSHPHMVSLYSDPEASSSITWTDQLTEGGLRRPTTDFVRKLKELDDKFNVLNKGALAIGPHFIKSLVNTTASTDLPISIKQLFFKCKMYFKIRILNKRVQENVKSRKRKLNKIGS